jgi:RimJ/RimL family protein N-acetyltransferase
MGLDRVWARADARNVASVRVLEKVGMRRKGLFRREVLRRSERVDRVCFGLLREEWEAAAGDHQ